MRLNVIRRAKLLACHFVFIPVHNRPERLPCRRKSAREDAALQRHRMRLPITADKQLWKSTLDARKAQHGLCVTRRHPVPETPQILARGVSIPVEEGVLQAIDFVASKTIGYVDHVARLKPFCLVYHRNERVRYVLPGDPIVPAELSPSERFVANIELRLERQWMLSGL